MTYASGSTYIGKSDMSLWEGVICHSKSRVSELTPHFI
jgi:hypothetical protein